MREGQAREKSQEGEQAGEPMRWRSTLIGCWVFVVCGCVASVPARAAFEVKPGSFTVIPSSERAGAHPNLTTSFAITQDESGIASGLLRNAEVVLPVGFAGYPAAVKTCDPGQLQHGTCPVGSQVGTLEVVLRMAVEVNTFSRLCSTWRRLPIRRPCMGLR